MDKYGVQFADYWSDLEIELWCFENDHPTDKGGLGAYRHFRNAARLAFPNVEWSNWTVDQLESLCENKFNSWTGCAAAGKSFSSGIFAMLWWLVAPNESSVVLTSTTGKMVRKRVWPVIQELYHGCKKIPESPVLRYGFPGNMVDSKTSLQASKGDDKHGIYAIAVRDGSTQKAVAEIQGVHSKRMLIIIDEATDTPEAIFESLSNLRKGCDNFHLLVIGNPISHLDPHGMCCEPEEGWDKVNVDDDWWKTAGVPKWEIDPGICLHFDGLKSPNVKLGHKKFNGIFTAEDLERVRKIESGEESINFWKFTRGFWPPEGVCQTLFSEAMCERQDVRGKHTFISKATLLAALDPAFGGDRCTLKFGTMGDIDQSGKLGITMKETVEINPKAKSKFEVDYQIAHRAIEECKSRGVTPDCFALDATGIGRGVAAIIIQEWSSEILKVEFSAAASKRPASSEDSRPSCDVYDRKVTELWCVVREFIKAGQLKGLTRADIKELCSREYEVVSRKYSLNTKEKCRQILGFSPDNADCISILCELARHKGMTPLYKGLAPTRNDSFFKVAKETNSVYENEDASDNPSSPIDYDPDPDAVALY